jgi:hypothetical protein
MYYTSTVTNALSIAMKQSEYLTFTKKAEEQVLRASETGTSIYIHVRVACCEC